MSDATLQRMIDSTKNHELRDSLNYRGIPWRADGCDISIAARRERSAAGGCRVCHGFGAFQSLAARRNRQTDRLAFRMDGIGGLSLVVCQQSGSGVDDVERRLHD